MNISASLNYFFNRAPFLSEAQLISDTSRFLEKNDSEDSNYFEWNNGTAQAENIDETVEYGQEGIFDSITTGLPLEHKVNCTFALENLWNVLDEQYFRHSWGWTISLVVAYTLILVSGIVGNIMVILVVALRPPMRTVTNMFIMNLAVADLFVVVFCVPATLLASVFTPWILGSFMCKAVTYVQGISVCASAYSLAAISLDRCKGIYRPMKQPRDLSKSQALFIICLIWIFALVITIPSAVIFNVTISDIDGFSYCIETWEKEQHGQIYFLVTNLLVCYCFPLVLISISNGRIWWHVSHRKVPQDSASASTIQKMHRETRHGVRKMLSVVTFVFLLSWLPLYVLVTRVKFSKNISQDELSVVGILMPIAQWLGSGNSSINPILYAFLNSKFREMFQSLLPSWLPFVSRNNTNLILEDHVGKETATNRPFGGTSGTSSCSYQARSSTVRNSDNSRRSHYYSRTHSPSPRTMATNGSQFRLPPASPVALESKTELVNGTPRILTVPVILESRGVRVQCLESGKVPSTSRSAIETDV